MYKRAVPTRNTTTTTSQILSTLGSPEKENLFKKTKINVVELLQFGPKPPLNLFKGRASARPQKFYEGNYTIHTLATLPELVANLRKRPNLSVITLRFLLNEHLELLFAEDGDPTQTRPPHWRMTNAPKITDSVCASAGNVTLNEKNQIIHISNKSGGFHPLYDSLQWVIGIIVAYGLEFADNVTVTKLSPEGNLQNFAITSQQLKDLINGLFSTEELRKFKQTNSGLPTRDYQYVDPNKSIGPRRRMWQPNFDDIPAGGQNDELLDAALQFQS